LAGLEKEMSQKKIQIEDLIPEQTEIYADRDLLRIVYDNLLSNAIKYGKENGKIRLKAEKDNGRMVLSVYNEGQGIPQDKIARLFRKFSRLDSPGCAGKKGTGLGLYICREIIEKHGGEIWAKSEEGKWAKFLFSLPQGHLPKSNLLTK
jgi:signal transduction histidine kinase